MNDTGNRLLDQASTKAKQKMGDIFGKKKETKKLYEQYSTCIIMIQYS